MGATATYELDTERDRDAEAIAKKAKELNEVNNYSLKYISLQSI